MRQAALLAWEGYLTCLVKMRLEDLDIRDIPRDQLARLASLVTERVEIVNVTHNDQLSSILDSVQCSQLRLKRMALGEAETRALVTAMRDRVEGVVLWYAVTLDIEGHQNQNRA